MSVSIRYFTAEPDGIPRRLSLAQMRRWCDGELLPPHLAVGGELKYLEVAVETEGRQVVRVLQIVPHRHGVVQGRIDMNSAMRQAMERVHVALQPSADRSAADEIKLLEADANAFWAPTDDQVAMVGSLLYGERLAADRLDYLRSRVFRLGASIYGDGDDD